MDRAIFLLAMCFWGGGLIAQPTANFTAAKQQGCVPAVISFEDQSTDAVAWSWDFGVSTSTLQNPTVLFTGVGTHDVTLIVTDALGAKDTLTKPDFIEVYALPQAKFTADQTSACSHTPISFTDQSLSGGSNILSWQWDFGDGNTSDQANPVHTYTSAGSYPVSLYIITDAGCSDDLIKNGYVTIMAPDASFSGDSLLACGPPLQVSFTPVSMSGTHQWKFGDGSSGLLPAPSHVYTSYGSFSVSHIVNDAQGCSDTLTREQYVNIGVNSLGIGAEDSTLCKGDSVHFFSNAASNSTVIWDLGNGDSIYGPNPSYKYSSPGVYTVTTSIEDPGGCSAVRTLEITVYDSPVPNFTVADTTVGCRVPFPVQFVDQSTGTVASYTWTFGDGSTSNQANPLHIYQTQDTFRVKLEVVGPGGCRKVRNKARYIQIQEIQTGFVTDKSSGCVSLDVAFTDTTQSPFPLTDWLWDFGDGTTSTQSNPIHTYAQTGVYDVQLVTTNSKGCQDTLLVPASVRVGNRPTANFVAPITQACALSPVPFINMSTGAGNYIWYFGDGDTAMSTHPEHGFAALGFMDVMLVAIDRGCADTLLVQDLVEVLAPLPIMAISEKRVCSLPREIAFQDLSVGADSRTWLIDNTHLYSQPTFSHTFHTPGLHEVSLTVTNFQTGCVTMLVDTIQIVPLEANFVADTNRGCIPFKINLTDQSTNAIDWKWYFGTGDSSEIANPKYTYKEAGDYPISLIVKNYLNCRDTMVMPRVRALDIVADITVDRPNGCVPLAVTFADISQGTGNSVSWEWDLGDSTYSTLPSPSHIYNEPGNYDISLTVTDGDGCQDSITVPGRVFATQPVPDMLITPPVNCELIPTTFVSLSEGVGLSYIWDFGDGDSAMIANTTHTYLDTGVYTISLHVTDVNGCDSSISVPYAVEIRTLSADFTLDTTYAACPPLNVSFAADTAFPHAGIQYEWDFGDGATSTQSHPQHNYTLPGTYTVRLIVSTPAGCSDTLIMTDAIEIEGPTGEFSFGPVDGCPGTEVSFSAYSSDLVQYEWIFGDGNMGIGTQATHTYTEHGEYVPVLVIEDTTGCRVFHISDSTVEIYAPPQTQISVDQATLCDSGQVQFTDNTIAATGVTDWAWTFGNGQTSIQQHPSVTFSALGSYDISLITTGAEGCKDTLDLSAYVHVLPSPKPGIVATDTAACVPFLGTLKVQADNPASPIIGWEWDLDQGNTSSAAEPSFGFLHAGEYSIEVIVTDTAGCQGEAFLSLTAFALPEPDFIASDSFGCAPFPIQLTQQTPTPIVQAFWNMGNGDTLSGMNPQYTYPRDGVFGISLRVTDANGCEQTFSKTPYIHLSHPVAGFEVSETLICPSSPIDFTDLSTSDTTLRSWAWHPGTDVSPLTHQHPSFIYDSSGTYSVSLIVTDLFGCKDTVIRPDLILVREDVEPRPVALRSVSVLGDKEVEVRYEAYNNADQNFGAYLIYRRQSGGNWLQVGRVDDINQTRFVDQGIATRKAPICYRVQVENPCGTAHPLELAESHCTVELETKAGVEQVLLSWHPYEGWPRVESYRIHRVYDYDPAQMELLTTVSGSDTSYLDTNMYCYDTYRYRIEAVGGPGRMALSDTAFAAPAHNKPNFPNDVFQVTVEDDQYVFLQWNKAQVEDPVALIVQRRNLPRGSFQEIARQAYEPSVSKYLDTTAHVQQEAYTYRLFTEDMCGDQTPIGQSGNSILLKVKQLGGIVHLDWNVYEGWAEGVDRYEIEVYDEASGTYQRVGSVSAGKTHFETSELLDQSLSCFRVMAHEKRGAGVTSLSNEACIEPDPIMFAPNAFTPNGDAFNDQFVLTGLFLTTQQFQIYDRWGKLIFETEQADAGWDGTDLAGKPAPEGVYMYHIKGIGYSGKPLNRRGSITLIR